jgi:hypothetical protein
MTRELMLSASGPHRLTSEGPPQRYVAHSFDGTYS